VFALLGDSPASEFYMPMFRNPLPVPSSINKSFFSIMILYGSYTELQLCLLFYGCETQLSHIKERTYTRIGCSERHWVLILYNNYHLSPTVSTVHFMWAVSQVMYINMIYVRHVETYSCQITEQSYILAKEGRSSMRIESIT
jgi:hypothetical protein